MPQLIGRVLGLDRERFSLCDEQAERGRRPQPMAENSNGSLLIQRLELPEGALEAEASCELKQIKEMG
jgi:hypothetical protein